MEEWPKTGERASGVGDFGGLPLFLGDSARGSVVGDLGGLPRFLGVVSSGWGAGSTVGGVES